MPIIKIETIKTSEETKEKLIAELTKTASEILGFKPATFYVLIKENETDNWGVGGETLTKFLQKANN